MASFDATSVLTVALAGLVASYLWVRHRQNYWKKYGVPTPPCLPFIGHFYPVLSGAKSFIQTFLDLTAEFRTVGYCGVYLWSMPALLVFDPEMVKQVINNDFTSFHDRGVPSSDSDPLSQHLFNLSGSKWRNLRNRLTPTFTSGKLKLMFPLMHDIGAQLSTTMAVEAKKASGELDIAALMNRFSTDIIGSVAFGINCNSLANENSEFLAMSRGLFRQTPAQYVRMVLEAIHPKLGQLLPFKFLFNKVHRFFMDLMRETVEYRERHVVERNDFLQLMMQVRGQDGGLELTPGLMAAQGFLFFVAGLDNVSNTVAYCLHRLAQDAELQQRVAEEVRAAIERHDGQLTYQGIKEMDLVNRVLLEALRLWSPLGILFRKCNKTTKVGEVTVEKDIPVLIVADRMHRDPAIFPDPERFDPDRHTAEARQQRHRYAYLPFGEGPRICIAERFAMLEMKIALAILLRDFKFTPGSKFEIVPKRDPKAFFQQPLNGFPMRVEVRT